MGLFSKKNKPTGSLLIIKKNKDDDNVKEYKSIEDAIADLESDPNSSADKIRTLRKSLERIINKSSIKIENGELLK
jgi:phosphomevalonate kinase